MMNKDVDGVLRTAQEKDNLARTKKRDEEYIATVLQAIEKIWCQMPHCRLGQLLGNCAKSEMQLYYLEDDKLLDRLTSIYEINKEDADLVKAMKQKLAKAWQDD